jgi:hypothetical protein
MRFLLLALCAACLPAAALRAADSDEQKAAPEEIPNFNQLDEFVYVPKSTLSLGTRFFLHGPKTTYWGQGTNPSPVNPGGDNTLSVGNISRTYIDGTVEPDARTVTQNAGLGGEVSVPISPDGRTNTWSYDNASQLLPSGNMSFHTYSAEVTDQADHGVNGAPNAGLELILDRDMGNLGKKLKWSFTVGFSIADIHSSSFLSVPTNVMTVTDTYDLFGQVPPAPPYNSPNTVSQTVYGAGGTVQSGSTTTTATQSVVQQTLLGNKPISRDTQVVATDTQNRYFNEGAFYTLRFGPTLQMPMGKHFKLTVSVGPAAIYLGSQINVLETLVINPTTTFTDLYQKENSKLLPAYYGEANLEYQLTDTAGFYVGAIYEGAGSYTQSVPSGTSASGAGLSYSSRLDFGNQEGLKGGMTVRF